MLQKFGFDATSIFSDDLEASQLTIITEVFDLIIPYALIMSGERYLWNVNVGNVNVGNVNVGNFNDT